MKRSRKAKSASRVDAIKKRVSIADLIDHIGGDVGNSWNTWASVRCAFHDDGSASASINQSLDRYNCHACGISGTVIDVAMAHLDTTDVVEALDWLERTF